MTTPPKERPTPRQKPTAPRVGPNGQPVEEVDFEDIMASMGRQNAEQARQIAMLEARLAAAQRKLAAAAHTHPEPPTVPERKVPDDAHTDS